MKNLNRESINSYYSSIKQEQKDNELFSFLQNLTHKSIKKLIIFSKKRKIQQFML